jgi:flagellar assembly protein FliH
MSLSKKVIKSNNIELVEAVSSVVSNKRFVRDDFEAEATQDAAHQKPRRSHIDEIRMEAEKKIKAAEKEFYDKGYAAGFRKGAESKEEETATAIGASLKLIREIEQIKKSTLENSEKNILDLVFAVAEKVIHQEVSEDRGVVASILKEAIKDVLDREGMKIRLNPKDYTYLSEISPPFLTALDGIRNVAFEKDEGIGRGGLVIETLFGEVDARIEQQVKEVRQALDKARG